VSLAFRWGTWGASVSAIEEHAGQCVPRGPEHEVVDDELRPAIEEIAKGLGAGLGLETVVLLDQRPGKLPALPGELVAQPRVFLFADKQLSASSRPFILRSDLVTGHRVLSSGLCHYTARTGLWLVNPEPSSLAVTTRRPRIARPRPDRGTFRCR
jgi:hypothetical protein